MSERKSFFDPEPDESAKPDQAGKPETPSAPGPPAKPGRPAQPSPGRPPSAPASDDPGATRPFRPVRSLNAPEDMPRPATSRTPETPSRPAAPSEASRRVDGADPAQTLPPTRPLSPEQTQPPTRPPSPAQGSSQTQRPARPADPGATQLNRPDRDPGATQVRRPTSDPGATQVRRPTSDPGATQVRRPTSDPGATQVRRPTSDPGATQVRRPNADPGVTQIRRPTDDAANTIPPRRIETSSANPGSKTPPPSWTKRGLVLLWWGVQAALAVVVGAVVFDRIVMPLVVRQGQEVVIPAVDGLSVDRASELLVDAGLDPMEAPGKYSALLPRGQVLEASPTPGLSVKRGRQVFLTPSLGMENRLVPDVEGLSLRLAGVRLQETGLKVGDVHYTSTDRVRPGEVIASAPAQGSPLPNAGTVSLLLAREKAPVPFWLPDLSGRPGVETAAWLEACGFKVFIYETSFPGTPGSVVRQSPTPGDPVWPSDRVDLTVAREGGSYDDADPFDRYDRNDGDSSGDDSKNDSRSGNRRGR